jgi:5-methylcytosine-specific restriction endonuclease McrA
MRPNFRPNFKRGRSFAKGQSKRKNVEKELYGEKWEELSYYIRKRDNWTCRISEIANKRCNNYFPPPFHNLLHAHHIIPLPKGTNHPSNLITLCKDCHGWIHGKNLGTITRKQKSATRNLR